MSLESRTLVYLYPRLAGQDRLDAIAFIEAKRDRTQSRVGREMRGGSRRSLEIEVNMINSYCMKSLKN